MIVVPDTPDYAAASMDDFISPPRSGPYGPGQIGSLDELYSSPVGGFNIDKNLVSSINDNRLLSTVFLLPNNSGHQKIVVISK